MAEESAATEVPTSFWGLPLDWDGCETRPHAFFVDAIDALPREAWDYIYKSTNTAWVIIPSRSTYAYNDF